MTTPAPSTPSPDRRRHRLILALIFTIHLGFSAYALPFEDVFGRYPYSSPDYQTHYGQTTTLSKVMDRFGKFWAYDPSRLAGHPVGLIFDVDNKLHFLFTYGLTKLGLSRPAAFNLFTLVSVLLAPLCLWLAARLFRLDPTQQLVAAAFSVLLWHFDSASRFAWAGGMISFATVSYLSVLVLALFYRMVREGQWRHWLFIAVLLPLSLLTHVWTFAILVVPMVGLYLKRWRRLTWIHHAQIWGLVVVAIGVNLYWLLPALRFAHLISPSGVVGQVNPLYFISDWLEFLVNPINSGFIYPHTMFRFAALCGVVLTLWRWRKDRDERFFVATLSTGWLLGMAYFAALIPGLRETEPYRFVLPTTLLLGVLGSPWYASLLTLKDLRTLPGSIKALMVVVLVLLVPRAVGQIAYFVPEVSPEVSLPPIVRDQAKAPPTMLMPVPKPDPAFISKTWRLRGVKEEMMKLVYVLEEECREEGRFLIQHWVFGELLSWALDKPTISGFPDRRMFHEAAFLFRRPDDPRFWDQDLADYLVRYNIRYVVMTEYVSPIERRRDLLEPYKLVGPHRIYRVRHHADYFMSGSGKVHADLNRIEVSDAKPAPDTQSITLRFHHMETLRCSPNCQVLKAPIPHDPVGFITVVGSPVLPDHFVVEHRY